MTVQFLGLYMKGVLVVCVLVINNQDAGIRKSGGSSTVTKFSILAASGFLTLKTSATVVMMAIR